MKVEIWGIYDPNVQNQKVEDYRWKADYRAVTIVSNTFFRTEKLAEKSAMRFIKRCLPDVKVVKFVYEDRSNTEFIV